MTVDDVVALGNRSAPQERAWHAIMDLHEVLPPYSWTLVGGSMVALHCAERLAAPSRETFDVDAVLDVREVPLVLMKFTTALHKLGFRPAGESFEGHQHRWTNDGASIDILIPSGVGVRAASRKGAGGGTTLETPAGQQALDRSEEVSVLIGGREGAVFRPNMLGAIVAKSAAYGLTQDRNRDRHLDDLSTLLSILRPSDDLRGITKRDQHHLAKALPALAQRLDEFPGVNTGPKEGIRLLSLAVARANTKAPTSGGTSALLSDGERDAQRDLDEQSMLRIESFLDVALRPDPKPKLPPLSVISPMVSALPKGGECGAATATGISCRNPRGSCPHHGR